MMMSMITTRPIAITVTIAIMKIMTAITIHDANANKNCFGSLL